ncbi:MAG: YkgJ family cysteine cluster protein [Candidatus Eisenbacteria bacterium]|uniref:YkgJ family cysteine cluster protein n=1 Tax=Eiseniibacteriota bacterium TaxID=2212470 RepID=A0A948S1T8_UNCEI|nr:YkgJ family cysteine cluster protein [Candidatus Eisenbacteria bacterium]MBU1947645.1 YkgJ family cysteine cluster protein [Candidatus Eisenbacteria bacterium]MBU2692284.1 YkgJ family cysteine cluster protein [Candidatus Eisenbacteria bacterium]
MSTKAQKKDTGVWYKDGLQFTCTRCGKCCQDREDPTFVFLEEDDIQRLSECMNISPKQVLQRYCQWSGEDGYTLKRKPGSCIFFDECIGCRVYPARPLQCRTWPFWPWNMRQENWNDAVKFCPGCNKGEKHNAREIETTAKMMLGRRGEGSLWPGEISLPK